jgi:hypothetical protein
VISERDLLARFEGVIRQKDGDWLVPCPAHADGRPSLHLTRKADPDRWLVHCFAGCADEEVCRMAGLTAEDVGPSRKSREPVAVYVYTDECSVPLFEVGRFLPKAFLQRLPGGTDWKGGIGKARRVVYRLPTVIAAVTGGTTVYVVEGEEDVHAIERVGAVATCNPGGAGKWRDEYSAILAGANVIVVADRDEVGREHARKVAASLGPVAASVRIVEPAEGKDARDHLTAGRRLDEFVGLPDSGDSGETLENRPKARNAGDLLIDMRAAMEAASEGFVYPLYPIAARGFLTVLAGRHSARKSWLMLLAGLAVQRGDTHLAGMTCTQTRVLYVDAENGPRLMGKRFNDAGIPPDGLLVADGTQMTLPRDIYLLDALIEQTGVGVVVLDSLRRLTPGKRENDSDDMAPTIGAIANLARKHNVAIVLIHHRSVKAGAANTRGSSSIEDQADLVFTLERKPGGVALLHAVKFRIDSEPGDLWIRFSTSFDIAAATTRMVLESADAQSAETGGDGEQPRTTAEALMAQIRQLAAAVEVTRTGWSPQRLAAAVGRTQDNGSFKQAIKALVNSGEWIADGQTRDRVYRPADSGNSGNPLGEQPKCPNQAPDTDLDPDTADAELQRLRDKFGNEL